jgi:hypothetical protein
MSARPPDGSDQPEAPDQVMLAVLSNTRREAIVLSSDEERLLDDWAAGRLAPEAAERAAGLVKRNALAAERVLERRLLDAARHSPPVPQSLAERVLKSTHPPKTSVFGGWWRSLHRRHWIGIAGAAALAGIAAIAVAPMLQQTTREGAPLQVAMATFRDRTPLFEASDIRMRGTGPPPSPADLRFRDVEVPTGILRNLVATAGQPAVAAPREIEAYLPLGADSGKGPLRVVVDTALKDKVETSDGRERLPVRIYDLKDPRAADIRRLIDLSPGSERAYLLTVRP